MSKPECQCERLVKEAIESLEMNVDPVDRGAMEYQAAIRDGKNRCPVHGIDFYRKTQSRDTSGGA